MGPQPRQKKMEAREGDMRVEVHLYPDEESSFTVIQHGDGGEEKTEFGDPDPDDDEDGESDAGPLEDDDAEEHDASEARQDDESAEAEEDVAPAEDGDKSE